MVDGFGKHICRFGEPTFFIEHDRFSKPTFGFDKPTFFIEHDRFGKYTFGFDKPTFDIEHDGFALGRLRVDHTAVLALVFPLDLTDL